MPQKNCAHCGKEFHVAPSQAHRVNCCSVECGYAHKQVTRVCDYCGLQFKTNKKRSKRFCSRACSAKGMVRHSTVPNLQKPNSFVMLNCEWCGRGYTIHRYFIEGGRVSRFCSKACLGLWHSATLRGNKSARWKGGKKQHRGANWATQKRYALERDNRTCQICKVKNGKKKYFIHVHHITPFRLFNGDYLKANELSNLITLCWKCHKKVERGDLNCPRPLL